MHVHVDVLTLGNSEIMCIHCMYVTVCVCVCVPGWKGSRENACAAKTCEDMRYYAHFRRFAQFYAVRVNGRSGA